MLRECCVSGPVSVPRTCCYVRELYHSLVVMSLSLSFCSYLIVKEDKTLESYGLNAGTCCTRVLGHWGTPSPCHFLTFSHIVVAFVAFVAFVACFLLNHSVHSLGLRRPLVGCPEQVHVPLPWIPVLPRRCRCPWTCPSSPCLGSLRY
jgi:hypothetical protein